MNKRSLIRVWFASVLILGGAAAQVVAADSAEQAVTAAEK